MIIMAKLRKRGNLQKSVAVELLQNGEIVACEAVPAVMKHGWYLQIRFADGHTELLKDVRGKEKWFGKTGTITDVASDIGFKAINIHLAEKQQ